MYIDDMTSEHDGAKGCLTNWSPDSWAFENRLSEWASWLWPQREVIEEKGDTEEEEQDMEPS